MAGKEGNGKIVEPHECYRKMKFLIGTRSHLLLFENRWDLFRLGLEEWTKLETKPEQYASRAFSSSNPLQHCHSG